MTGLLSEFCKILILIGAREISFRSLRSLSMISKVCSFFGNAMRVWLVRIGFGGAEHKTDRKVLMEHLSGPSAFRNDEEKTKWMERQKAKRDAARAAQNEEGNDDAVSE